MEGEIREKKKRMVALVAVPSVEAINVLLVKNLLVRIGSVVLSTYQ